jgi:hypothetical protein
MIDIQMHLQVVKKVYNFHVCITHKRHIHRDMEVAATTQITKYTGMTSIPLRITNHSPPPSLRDHPPPAEEINTIHEGLSNFF